MTSAVSPGPPLYRMSWLYLFSSGAANFAIGALSTPVSDTALLRQLDACGDDDEAVRMLGVEVCTEICRRALAHGTHGIHFYCLNRTQSCGEILRSLDLVLLPERVVKLNTTAAEVLRLCDGSRTVRDIILELQARFEGPSLEGDVVALLGRLAERGVVE